MDTRRKVERLYVCAELFNGAFSRWLKVMFPPTLIGLSVAIILTTFVSIRFTNLPFFLYIVFPYVAVTLMLIIFWISYDAVVVTRSFEDVLAQLLSHDAAYLGQMGRKERTRVMKRARAMRPVNFPIGEFADFSMNFPFAVWDEILNQVLFLLSF